MILTVFQLILVLNVYYMSASATYVLFVNIYGFFGGMTCFFIGDTIQIFQSGLEEEEKNRYPIILGLFYSKLRLIVVFINIVHVG